MAMPAKHGVVRNDDAAGDLTVVPDVGPNHQKAIVSDGGHPAATLRADIDRDALTNLAPRAHEEPSEAKG